MEKWYQQVSLKFTPDHFDLIREFYEGWEGQDEIDIKFRFIKIMARNGEKDQLEWYNFHDLVNKRRITNDELPQLLRTVIDQGIYPLRIFHSCTEWLAPNEVWRVQNPRIIRSGFIPFENDDDLKTSLQTACMVKQFVENPIFVYSGNKSIHTWVHIEIDDLEDKVIAYADQREKAERNFRYQLFHQIRDKIQQDLDNRISADPRRVVPIIDTLNAFTGNIVTKINAEQICDLSSEQVKDLARWGSWIPLMDK